MTLFVPAEHVFSSHMRGSYSFPTSRRRPAQFHSYKAASIPIHPNVSACHPNVSACHCFRHAGLGIGHHQDGHDFGPAGHRREVRVHAA